MRGLQRMIEEQRDCSDVIVQVLSIRAALDQVGVQLLDHQLGRCLGGDGVDVESLKKSLRLWLKLGGGG